MVGYDAVDTAARCFLMVVALRLGRLGIGDGGVGLGVRLRFVFLLRFVNSSANKRTGLIDGDGLNSGCSSGSLDRSCTSGGRLYRGFGNSCRFPRLEEVIVSGMVCHLSQHLQYIGHRRWLLVLFWLVCYRDRRVGSLGGDKKKVVW